MATARLVMLFLFGTLIAITARADVFHMAPGLTSVEFVTVGNPGNAPDTRYDPNGVGSVDHVYQMGKYEITAGQYTEFLNAVAKSDPNGLYSPAMGVVAVPSMGANTNIQQNGSSPNFSYSVAADWANRPVNYVNFWDVARFANWLNNGQPTGAQSPETTESGAYHDVGNSLLFGRNADAKYFIPTGDEWYKAAYHNKSAGLAASYFDYPTGSNIAPLNTLPDPGNHANYRADGPSNSFSWTIDSPYWRTNVGEFVNSPSPYGTFDQGGNVWEWNETPLFPYYAAERGGNLSDGPNAQLGYFQLQNLLYKSGSGGFRAASLIPEPSTGVLAILACCATWWSIKRFSV